MKHQESGITNLQNIISNPRPLLSTPALWFHLSGGYLIIMLLIMVMLRFTLQSLQLNLTLNLFQILTPLRLNQLMMMKWKISWNFSTHNMIQIFWMLISICFRIYWWYPLLQKCIQSLLCCSINMKEQRLQSQIACHTFFVKLANGKTGHAQGIGIILCCFPNFSIIY